MTYPRDNQGIREHRRQVRKRWNSYRLSKGMCSSCLSRKAGSNGGTARTCGLCRRRRLKNGVFPLVKRKSAQEPLQRDKFALRTERIEHMNQLAEIAERLKRKLA